MFSFATNEWLDRARIPVTIASQAVIALDDDTALMCGGWNQVTHSYYRVCFIYTASTNVWTAYKWAMNVARADHGMTVYNSRVYVYGGNNVPHGISLSSAEILSDSNGWHLLSHGLAIADQYFASMALTTDDTCHYYCECKRNSSTLCVDGMNCECNLTANAQNNTKNDKSVIRTFESVGEIRQITNTSNNPLYGILINSNYGTQAFDFDYYPYSTGNLQLGLNNNDNVAKLGSRAVIIGNNAFFVGTDGSLSIYGE
jgi:hypothetical protein